MDLKESIINTFLESATTGILTFQQEDLTERFA